MAKKDFKGNPALAFISNVETVEEQEREEQKELKEEGEGKTIIIKKVIIKKETPKGLKNNPEYIETKSKRVQLLMQPSTVEGLKRIAKRNKTSMNDLMNLIAKEFIKENEE